MPNLSVPKLSATGKGIIALLVSFLLNFSGNVTLAANVKNYQPFELQLKRYIGFVEKQNHIPSGLLAAITKVESGYKPYAINIAGNSLIAKNRWEAVRVIKGALAKGITNIDIGVAQINYRWHKENFSNVEEMINPKTNIRYAAQLLRKLYNQHGNWHKAIRYYHSANSLYYRKYSRKVVLEWLQIS